MIDGYDRPMSVDRAKDIKYLSDHLAEDIADLQGIVDRLHQVNALLKFYVRGSGK